MDLSNHIPLTEAELNGANLNNVPVYGPENEPVGHVSQVHGSGMDYSVVVDVGGFLGIGSKPVSLTARDLEFMRDKDNVVHAVTHWTKDELKDMPAHRL